MRLRTKRSKVSTINISIKLRNLIFDVGLSVLEAGRQALRLLDLDFRDVRWDKRTKGMVSDEGIVREKIRESADKAGMWPLPVFVAQVQLRQAINGASCGWLSMRNRRKRLKRLTTGSNGAFRRTGTGTREPSAVLLAIHVRVSESRNDGEFGYLYTLKPATEVTRRTSTGNVPGPFQHTILQVCRRWMDVMTNTPILWASIEVLPLANVTYVNHFLRCALRWSGDALLNIKAPSYHCCFPENILPSYSSRWRTLYLTPCYENWTSMQHDGIPFLESLVLSSYKTSKPTTFMDAPALKRLKCAPSAVVRTPFPWTQIVELDAHVNGPFDRVSEPEDKRRFLDILAIAPLRMLSSNDKTMSGFPSTGITKPDVEVAQLPPNWLPHFIFPALRKYIHRADSNLTTQPILELIRRSGCTLTHLDIRDADPTREKAEALEALLKGLPQLQELNLYIPSNPDNADCLSLVLRPLTIEGILPGLHAIRLKVSVGGYFPNGTIWCRNMCWLLHTGRKIIDGKRQALRY
ncbi:hypothetical protein CYLTODRAFT_483660, partial [Cylindrobasidium torrendii FP15055 ss-10]